MKNPLLHLVAVLLLPFGQSSAESIIPDPISAVVQSDSLAFADFLYPSQRVYQQGAALVPYVVSRSPSDPLIADWVGDTGLPLELYGPSICLTDPVVLNPLGATGYDHLDGDWAALLPGSDPNRIVAYNRQIGDNDTEETLSSRVWYASEVGWVNSAVLGWIYSYGTATEFFYGGWYYLPGRGNVYIRDRGLETSTATTGSLIGPVEIDVVHSTYHLWDPVTESWYYLNAKYPETIYDLTNGGWFNTVAVAF